MANPGSLPRSEALNIEYDLDVLARIEETVRQAFNSANGAQAASGLLLGSYTGHQVRIAGFEALVQLSADEKLLAERIRHYDTCARMNGKRVVGWYHSQTDGTLAMSEADTLLHDRYFPEVWQISLLLGSNANGGMDAKFFLKERLALATAIDPAVGSSLGPENDTQPEPEQLFRNSPDTSRNRRGGGRRPFMAAPELPAETPAPVAFEPVPDLKMDAHRRMLWRGWGVWAGLAALALLSIAGAVYLRTYYSPASGRSPATGLLPLEAVHHNGNIEVTWDPGALRGSSQGHLDVQDGGIRAQVLLDRKTLVQGKFSYAYKSDVTGFRLRVENYDGSALEGSTTYVAPNGSGALAANLPALPTPPLPDTRGFRERARDLVKETFRPEPAAKAKPSPVFHAPVPARSEAPKEVAASLVDLPTIQPSQVQAQAAAPPLFAATVQQIAPPQIMPKAPAPAQAQVQAQTQSQIAGRWTLQPGSLSRSPAVPESIAIQVSENDGALAGTLDARYRSGSKKERLNFSFAGKAGSGPVRLPWSSSDGQKGHIEFLRVPNSSNIEVVWYGADSKRVYDEIVRKSN